MERQGSLFYSQDEIDQLRQLAAWSLETGDGSLSDLDHKPTPAVWDEVVSESGNCMGRQCPTHAQCFYYRARRRCQHAQLLLVNHALFFSDLALRGAAPASCPTIRRSSLTRRTPWNRWPATIWDWDSPPASWTLR